MEKRNRNYIGTWLLIMFQFFLLGCSQKSTVTSMTNIANTTKPMKQNISSTNKPHVLFISIDDLRPMLGTYGDPLAKTPNIDKLAKHGIQFNNAFAQQAICGPSRASVMTGMRPNTLGVTHNYVKFRDNLKDVVTLPQYFMQHGYNAAGIGKVFHHGDKDADLSWNWKPAFDKLPKHIMRPSRYALEENNNIQKKYRKAMVKKYGKQAKFGLGSGPAFESASVPDTAYLDGYTTEVAIATMKEIHQASSKPMFIGFGMNKPHLPWVAPKKYWDMYNPDDIKQSINRIKPKALPKNSASMGVHASFELRTFYNVPNYGDISPELAVELRHAYLACISYVDAQIGKMIQALKEEDLYEKTVVVLWSDHGYHLGDMGIWGKASNYEVATKVPLIFSTPDMRINTLFPRINTHSDALVELIDMYPTLLELTGLPKYESLDGKSLVPLFREPNKKWKTAAFSQFPTPALREWGAYPLRKGMRETYFGKLILDVEQRIKDQQGKIWNRELFEKHLMGYSMRTERYRFIAWIDQRDLTSPPIYVELYDHHNDENETINIAANNTDVVEKLMNELKSDLLDL